MERQEFESLALDYVHEYYKENNYMFSNRDNTFVVWFNYTLQNMKMLVGSQLDNKYFEFTYNYALDEIYVDVYNKIKNEVLKHE